MPRKNKELTDRFMPFDTSMNTNLETLRAFHGWALKVVIVLENYPNGMTADDLNWFLNNKRDVNRELSKLTTAGKLSLDEKGLYRLNSDYLNKEKNKTEKVSPCTPIAKEKKKKERKKSPSPRARARVRGEYLTILSNNDDTMRALCSLNGITIPDSATDNHDALYSALEPYFETFVDERFAAGDDNKDTKDLKSHFSYWLNKKRKIEKDEERRRKREEEKERRRDMYLEPMGDPFLASNPHMDAVAVDDDSDLLF